MTIITQLISQDKINGKCSRLKINGMNSNEL